MRASSAALLFLALVFPCLVFPQTAAPAQKLYGTWYRYPLGNPNTDSLRQEFRHNAATDKDEVIVTRLCVGDYGTIIARAVSPIEVTQDSIKILKDAHASERAQGNSLCQASIEAAVLGYSFSEDGTHVTLTNPGGNPDILELARQDVASEAVLPPNLYGTWLLPTRSDEGTRMQIRLVFYSTAESQHGKLRQISTCSKGNDSLISEVNADINVVGDKITIVESASHDERNGPFSCKAIITAGTLRYAIAPNGATMTLWASNGKPMTLTRERAAGLN
jgi:hypothetical protein